DTDSLAATAWRCWAGCSILAGRPIATGGSLRPLRGCRSRERGPRSLSGPGRLPDGVDPTFAPAGRVVALDFGRVAASVRLRPFPATPECERRWVGAQRRRGSAGPKGEHSRDTRRRP